MYIGDLINNPEFNFNAPLRILWYKGGDEGDDGVIEIEYAE